VVGDFSGKNVLILGGSRGIGAAIVRRFAKGDGKVAFTYAGSKEAAEALAAETEAEAIRADSTDRDALIATVASRGPLDILVSVAGLLVMGDPLTLDALMHSFMAIKRHIGADEIAEFTAFLAGPHGAMITGSMQTIAGGFAA
jgi:NAD(P)-dependent dehydrogenase (short-subunit alcohol dehydrogenase family)